jgi:hypothetical protein
MRRPTLFAALPAAALFALTAGLSACDKGSEPAGPPPEPTPAIADAAPVTATYRCDPGDLARPHLRVAQRSRRLGRALH